MIIYDPHNVYNKRTVLYKWWLTSDDNIWST